MVWAVFSTEELATFWWGWGGIFLVLGMTAWTASSPSLRTRTTQAD